jgi:hypothetical protein
MLGFKRKIFSSLFIALVILASTSLMGFSTNRILAPNDEANIAQDGGADVLGGAVDGLNLANGIVGNLGNLLGLIPGAQMAAPILNAVAQGLGMGGAGLANAAANPLGFLNPLRFLNPLGGLLGGL